MSELQKQPLESLALSPDQTADWHVKEGVVCVAIRHLSTELGGLPSVSAVNFDPGHLV